MTGALTTGNRRPSTPESSGTGSATGLVAMVSAGRRASGALALLADTLDEPYRTRDDTGVLGTVRSCRYTYTHVSITCASNLR